MELTDSDIIKFQEIYLDQFGEEISKEEAFDQGMSLLTLISEICNPETED